MGDAPQPGLVKQISEGAKLKARLIAASLSEREYRTLRNTVFILRGSGAKLDPQQEEKVKEFEAVVSAYKEQEETEELSYTTFEIGGGCGMCMTKDSQHSRPCSCPCHLGEVSTC